MLHIVNTFVDTLKSSPIEDRAFLGCVLFCALTGFLLYVYLIIVLGYSFMLSTVRFCKGKRAPKKDVFEDFDGFTSDIVNRKSKNDNMVTFVDIIRDWFSYSPDQTSIRTPVRLIMTPRRFLGKMTGLSPPTQSLQFSSRSLRSTSLMSRDTDSWKTACSYSESRVRFLENSNPTPSTNMGGFQRVQLTAVDE